MNRGSWCVRFVAAILFFSAVEEEVAGALLSISRAGCGESVLCVENPESCEPNGSSPCLFTSAAVNQSELSVSLRGDSEGYIALGLTNAAHDQGVSTLLVCALNGSDVLFRSVQRNNSDPDAPLSDLHMPVQEFRGQLVNGSVIMCSFSVPLSNISLNLNHSLLTLLLGSGAVANDSSLGVFNVSRTVGPVDLLNLKNETSTTAAPPPTPAPTELSISRAGCGESVLCVESPKSCEPNGSSPCLFTSAAVDQSELSVSLRGDSEGYITLGLTNASQDVSWFFVCGKRNGSFFFQTAQRNNSVQNSPLTPSNTSAEGVRGEVRENVTRCVFNVRVPDLRTSSGSDLVFQLILGTGAVNGTELGSLTEHVKTSPLDLSDPAATPAPPTVAPSPTPVPGRGDCPRALLSALTLTSLLTLYLTN